MTIHRSIALLVPLVGCLGGGGENLPPELQRPADVTGVVGELVQVRLEASDPDGDPLTYDLGEALDGAVVTGALFQWVPDAADVGTTTVQVSVSDDGDPPLTDTASFSVTVAASNEAPVADPVADQTVAVGDVLSLTLSATDPDGDALTWTSGPLPGDAVLTPEGALSFAPVELDVGSYDLILTVTDDGNPPLADVVEFTVGVLEAAPECLQEVAVASGQVAFTEDAVTFGATFGVTTSAPAPTTPLPSGFAPAAYHGAVDPKAAEPWWAGWTVQDPSIDGGMDSVAFHPLAADITGGAIVPAVSNACTTLDPSYADGGTVDVFGVTFPVCVVASDIVADVSWPNDHVFFLVDTVTVGTGDVALLGGAPAANATLTLAPGTQVYAAPGETSLVISRGSAIDAAGTDELPIVFAAAAGDALGITGDPTDLTDRGQWGGLVLSGFGQTNFAAAGDEGTSDYVPQAAERWFGGTDDLDTSGTLRYAVIAESGFEFRPGVAMPGLTLEAVGEATVIEYVQVVGSEGDGVVARGGTAPLSWLLVNGSDDDALDLGFGFRGTVQFGMLRMGASNGDRGIESANDNTVAIDGTPATAARIANVTVLGDGGGDDDTTAALHRAGARDEVYRAVFADDAPATGAFEAGCLDVDDVLTAELLYRDAVFDCSPAALVVCEAGEVP